MRNNQTQKDIIRIIVYYVTAFILLWPLCFGIIFWMLSNIAIAKYSGLVLALIMSALIINCMHKYTELFTVNNDGVGIKLQGFNKKLDNKELIAYGCFTGLLIIAIIVGKLYSFAVGLVLLTCLLVYQAIEMIRINRSKYPVAQVVITTLIITALLMTLYYSIIKSH